MPDSYTQCPHCGSEDLYLEEQGPQIAQRCNPCGGRWLKWVPKSEQPAKRPKLLHGTTEEVWAKAGGHCAHCGLSTENIEILGLQRTVQHVPPFKVNGHEGYLIPLCSWCQQHSATKMKQLESLIARLVKKFSMSGDGS